MVLCVNDNIISKKQLDYSLSLGGRGRGEGDRPMSTPTLPPAYGQTGMTNALRRTARET
jgi:hypothetical protein